MKKHSNKRGITLIALIITIIVLLILAGVSFSLAIGENGVITKAQNASEASKQAQIQEDIQTAYATAIAEGYDLSNSDEIMTKIKTELEDDYGTVSIVSQDNGYLVTVDGKSYFVSDKNTSNSSNVGTTTTPSENSSYTVQFFNYDGTALWSTTVNQGSSITYGGATPTRASDNAYTYTFNTWVTAKGGSTVADLTNIQSNTSVYAAYSATAIKYTVQFFNYDGTSLWSTTANYGSSVTYGGATPTKASDNAYTYTFNTWVTTKGGSTAANLTNIQSNTSVYAAYSATAIKYTVQFCNYDGTALWSTTVGSTKASLSNITSNTTFYASYYSNSVCFVAGTKVLTEKGLVNIEDIKVGMKVYSKNLATGKVELKEVVQTFENYVDKDMVKVYTQNGVIESTSNHPYYEKTKGWVSAKNLKAGDILINSNNEEVEVKKVEYIGFVGNELNVVYNIEVEDNHNYFVGTDLVLVHNAAESPTASSIKGSSSPTC
jgi:hypothetical protein